MKNNLLSAKISDPYAEALMSLAQNQNVTEPIGENVRDLLNLLQNSPELRQLLESPIVEAEVKKNILRQILGDGVHPFLSSFLMLLVDKRRIMFIEPICQQFQALLRKLNQTVLAEVISAVELSEEQKQSVRDKVIAMTSSTSVELQTKLDPELIGGVIIKVGSQVIDASLRGQLRRIGILLGSAA